MYLFLLICGIVLFPKAFTLKCHECAQDITGKCTVTEKQCPSGSDRCAALRVITYTGDAKTLDVNSKDCASADQCLNGSFNFGVARSVITSKCCTSDLCNDQLAPEPAKSNPNGKKCFSCDGSGECTGTLNCDGNEDYCVSAKVNLGDQKMQMKGCATKEMCSNAGSAELPGNIAAEMSCCQGDYCNSSSSTSAHLLLLVATLVSSLVFFS